jgi:quercetin dioxygenase-like cupin family protein
MGFFKADEFARKDVLPGIRVGSVRLENLMLTHFTFKAGSVVPAHSHPHEQITYLVEGEMEFKLDGETRLIRAGEGCAVPPGSEHGVRALTDAAAIDCWHPIREDYIVRGTES